MSASKRNTGPGSDRSRSQDDLNLVALFETLWQRKWIIVAVAGIVTVIAVAIAIWRPDMYRAEVLVAPSDEQAGDRLSSLASQYGGLASLAGFDLDTGDADQVALGLSILQSRKFIADFIGRHGILVPVIAARGWDRASGQLVIDPDIYDVEDGQWVREPTKFRQRVPSRQEAYEEFLEFLSVEEDSETGFVTVTVDFYSPILAKEWAESLVRDLNAHVMNRDVQKATQAIDYLENQLRMTSLAEMQAMFSRLIEEQMKTVLLAEVSPEYLFTTLDPAVAPEVPHAPSRPLIVVIGMLVGLVAGVLVSLGYGYLSSRPD